MVKYMAFWLRLILQKLLNKKSPSMFFRGALGFKKDTFDGMLEVLKNHPIPQCLILSMHEIRL